MDEPPRSNSSSKSRGDHGREMGNIQWTNLRAAILGGNSGATAHRPLWENDVLVRVQAIGFNPVDCKVRKSRTGPNVILGWDAAGTVEAIGEKVQDFSIGDRVFYAGDLLRDGCYAEYQAVDSRLIAKAPQTLGLPQAAAVPLTAITAYEALIEQKTTAFSDKTKVLVIGGAGGVGSMAIQLLKALTPSSVIATASRTESQEWCKELGADHVVDHSGDLLKQLDQIGAKTVDFVFCTTQSHLYHSLLPEIIRPFGHLTLIDDPTTFDIRPFKTKAIVTNFEFMFAKSMFNFEVASQGKLLQHVASLIDAGKIRTTLSSELRGLTPENVRQAHSCLESGKNVGKVVLTL